MEIVGALIEVWRKGRLSFSRFTAVILILSVLQFSTAAQAIVSPRCESLFNDSQDKIVVAELLRFVDDVSRTQQLRNPSVEALFDRLRTHSHDFLTLAYQYHRTSNGLTIDQKAELIVAYHERYFSNFRHSKSLSRLRNRSLLKGLRNHGYEPKSVDAKAELKTLSAENAARITRLSGLRDPWVLDREIESILDRVDLRIFRNAHHQNVSSGVILSSQRLKDYGLEGGANSIQVFNRQFLKSDDQIYFFIKFRPEGSAPESSRYGGVKQDLKIDEAQDDIWISPFVMYPDDLVRFAKRSLPAYKRSDLDTSFANELQQSTGRPETMTKIRDELHGFDFTFDDYRELTRRQLRKSLTALKYNPLLRFKFGASFAGAKAKLLSQIPDESSDELIDALVMRPLRLPKMEAKIPVALDAAAVSAH